MSVKGLMRGCGCGLEQVLRTRFSQTTIEKEDVLCRSKV